MDGVRIDAAVGAGSENNIQGWVGAFKVTDGSPVWRFNTVPKKGEPGFENWKNPKGIPTGGGAIWTSCSIDSDTGDMHITVANPAPDWKMVQTGVVTHREQWQDCDYIEIQHPKTSRRIIRAGDHTD